MEFGAEASASSLALSHVPITGLFTGRSGNAGGNLPSPCPTRQTNPAELAAQFLPAQSGAACYSANLIAVTGCSSHSVAAF